MKNFLLIFYTFFIYSIIGWIIESIYVSIKEKKFVDRGFLIGPYCPIYGLGALGMILYLEQYKNNIITVFFLSVIICSILEYITSYIMEKIFNARWWDYSKENFNLNGRICGKNSILFGIGGVIVIYIAHPFIKNILLSINPKILLIISIISLLIFLTDTIISFNIVNKLKNTITSIEPKKDTTQEFSKLIKETLIKRNKILQKRLFSAFPNIDLKSLIPKRKDIKDFLKKETKND